MKSLEYVVKKNTQFQLVFIVPRGVEADVCVRVRLAGRGAKAHIIGLVAGDGDHRISIHTEQLHEAPETTSNLLVKAALFDRAQFTYDGVIPEKRKPFVIQGRACQKRSGAGNPG